MTADEVIVDSAPGDREENEGEGERLAGSWMHYDRYRLKKYWRTNRNTVNNQRPIVRPGQEVKTGDVLADGAAVEKGQLALGSNVTVAFMPWYGHNFDRAMVLSERLVKDDVFSSIHIQELELYVRDATFGQEEITREIPNAAEEELLDLDERGIVRIGTRVKPGDILVGKITPKGDNTVLTPEERLLLELMRQRDSKGRSLPGDEAAALRRLTSVNSSLKVPLGLAGVVIDVKILSRVEDQLTDKDREARIANARRLERAEKSRIDNLRDARLAEILGQAIERPLKMGTPRAALHTDAEVGEGPLREMGLTAIDIKALRVENERVTERVRQIVDASNEEKARISEEAEERIDGIIVADELPPGMSHVVKIYVAEKRKASVGDSLAGRHGDEGVVAKVVPEEDMPFLPDGRPVDIVLNPLGVASRMDLGQIFETHLGWVVKILGFCAKTPVFQGPTDRDLGLLFKMAGVVWAAHALRLHTPAPAITHADVQCVLFDMARHSAKSDFASQCTLGDLLRPGFSQEARRAGERIVRFLANAAREHSARERIEAMLEGGIGESAGGAGADSDYHADRPARDIAKMYPVVEDERAARILRARGLHGLTSLVDGSGNADIDQAAIDLMSLAGLTACGKVRLRDGLTGEYYSQPVTVGELYLMKLVRDSDDRFQARSTGGYTRVSQQPRSDEGVRSAQAVGQPEMLALGAYGAAHTLQEMLTVKSDDMIGRMELYESLVKGTTTPVPRLPESLRIVLSLLQGLGVQCVLGRPESAKEGESDRPGHDIPD